MNTASLLEELSLIPNTELIAQLHELVSRSQALTAELLEHIGEVDARRLYSDAACASMFVFCVDRLHMSEGSAYKSIHAARAARRFPSIIRLVRDGALHLSAVTLLVPYLTDDNHLELLRLATHKSKRAVQQLLAHKFPQPDAPEIVRRLPDAKMSSRTASSVANAQPTFALSVDSGAAELSRAPVTASSPPRSEPGRLIPTAPERYRVQFTANQKLHDKLERARALLRHQIPDGDLAAVIEQAVDTMLKDIERKKFGKTALRTPRSSASTPQSPTPPLKGPPDRKTSRHIPNAVRRAVADRDGEQCTFVDTSGRRCQERSLLEYHHERPFARGGPNDPANLTLVCRSHNQHAARLDFGFTFNHQRTTFPGEG